MSSIKISLEKVRKEFSVRGEGGGPPNRFAALEDITLDVRAGEFLALVGPSGCGKSTLLDLLGGLAVPISGHILLDGHSIAGPARDRGVVFQQYVVSLADGSAECRVRARHCGPQGKAAPGARAALS